MVSSKGNTLWYSCIQPHGGASEAVRFAFVLNKVGKWISAQGEQLEQRLPLPLYFVLFAV